MIDINLDLCQMTEYQYISSTEDAKTRRLDLLSTKYPQANCYAVKQVLESRNLIFHFWSTLNSFYI